MSLKDAFAQYLPAVPPTLALIAKLGCAPAPPPFSDIPGECGTVQVNAQDIEEVRGLLATHVPGLPAYHGWSEMACEVSCEEDLVCTPEETAVHHYYGEMAIDNVEGFVKCDVHEDFRLGMCEITLDRRTMSKRALEAYQQDCPDSNDEQIGIMFYPMGFKYKGGRGDRTDHYDNYSDADFRCS